MPPMVVAAGAYGPILVAGTISFTTIMSIVSVALTVASFFLQPNAGSFEQRLQGLLVTNRGAVTYGRRLFGFTRSGGAITFLETSDGEVIENQFLHGVITFAYHEVQEFITVYFDDVPIHIRNLDDDGFVTFGPFADLVKIQYDNGARGVSGWRAKIPNDQLFGRDTLPSYEGDDPDTGLPVVDPAYCNEIFWQPFPHLQEEAPSWTVQHKQLGRAKLYIRLEANSDVFPNGIPNVTAVIKGTKELYDPRTETERWSPNPALAIRFLVRSNPAFRCGLGALADEVNEDSFLAAANCFDERVTIDPTKSLELRSLNIITDRNLVMPDADGKYRYFPAFLVDGIANRVAGADLQTGDGYYLSDGGAGDVSPGTRILPYELIADVNQKYYIIIKQFGQSPYFDKEFLKTDGPDYEASINLCKDIFAVGFAATYEDALNDIPIECDTAAPNDYPAPNVVYVGATKVDEARFQCNGIFEYDRSYADILEEMLTSCGARLVFAEGQYSLVSYAYVTPRYEFTKDDLVGEAQIQPKVGRRERFNVVEGVYSSPIHAFQPSAYPSATRQIYLDNDNYTGSAVTAQHINPRTLDLPFTTSPSASQRLARTALERARQEITVIYPVGLSGLLVTVGDTILLTDDDFGFEQKVFEVGEMEMAFTEDAQGEPVFGVTLTLKEHAAAIFDWTPGTDESALPDDLATNTTLWNAGVVKMPRNFAVSEDLIQINTGVGLTIRTTLTWDTAGDPWFDHYEVQYKPAAASEYLTLANTTTLQAELNTLEAGEYNFRVRTVNTAGVRSLWVTVNQEIFGLAEPPSAPTNLGVAQLSDALIMIFWDKTTDLDVEFGGDVIIRHDEDEFSGDVVNSVGIGSKIFPGGSTSAVVPNKTGTYIVLFRDSSGNYSTAAEIKHVRANTLSYSTLATITESPTFVGTKTDLQVIASELQLAYDGDTSPALDVKGAGTYLFNTGWTSGTAKNVRITTFISVIIQDNLTNIDDRSEPIDEWPSMDGVLGVECDARVQMRFKQGDPASSPTPSFGEWQNVDCLFTNTHDIEFRVLVTSDFGYANIKIGTLYVTIEEVI